MAWTFAAITDDINIGTINSHLNDNGIGLYAGWYYPTTLTAGRYYWGIAAGGAGAFVHTTTSEIRMKTQNATTPGEWVTSGAGITTNKWQFIAWLAAIENTTVAGAWRVWIGDGETPPAEVTVTNSVVRSGNYTGNLNFAIGNQTASTSTAFQGDIDWFAFVSGNAGQNSTLNISTSGVISNDEAEFVRERFVGPLWAGIPSCLHGLTVNAVSDYFRLQNFPLGRTGTRFVVSNDATTDPTPVEPPITGATYTEHRAPRRPPDNWPNLAPYVRR